MCCAVICLGWKTYSFTHQTHTFFPSITNLILQWQEFIGRAGKFAEGLFMEKKNFFPKISIAHKLNK